MADPPMPPPPDPSNVQGMVLRGYTHPYSCHMLFTFAGRPGAAAFIGALLPFVQSAQDWGANKPARMLNISLTYMGIRTFAPELKGQFPNTFELGPCSVGSQQSLQDTGKSDPKLWWDSQDKSAIHCIVHSYGMTADAHHVTAPPEDGRANKALLEVLREVLSLKRSQMELLSGAASREKRFLIRGVTKAEVEGRVARLLRR